VPKLYKRLVISLSGLSKLYKEIVIRFIICLSDLFISYKEIVIRFIIGLSGPFVSYDVMIIEVLIIMFKGYYHIDPLIIIHMLSLQDQSTNLSYILLISILFSSYQIYCSPTTCYYNTNYIHLLPHQQYISSFESTLRCTYLCGGFML
jgi:hypothetical protein